MFGFRIFIKMETYNPQKIEPKWQKKWGKQDLYKAEDFCDAKKFPKGKFYTLTMFPYPSAEGLHIGHVESYTAADIYCRYLRANGYNVLFPIGWDAFGLPAENYAIKKGVHPQKANLDNIKNYERQIRSVGLSYDWSRQINTTDPKYYKWTQWIFLKIFKKGLAYEDIVPINWCPSCKTGIANEEVVNGECERCHTKVECRDMKQWLLRITEYADRLVNDLNLLDWPDKIVEMQKNWIGRSEGYEINFKINGHEEILKVFTTRADTLFGATFMVLAPEHPFLKKIVTSEQKTEVEKYIKRSKQKSDLEREALEKEKTGVFTGAYAINPASGEKIPIWVSDYVMMNYGSGAIMAVPAHDERDFEFAKRHDLPITEVISEDGKPRENLEEAYVGGGKLVNSCEFDGTDFLEAREKIAKYVGGKKAVNYKLRDWVFSRQRYWGEPIPVVHCESCGVVPVPEKDLPVELPDVEKYEPTGTGESPLANIKDWVNTTCPECRGVAKRETNTMPQWAGSSWYYLRYIDPRNSGEIFDKKKMRFWSPVDVYIGGAEHAVLHLLYARFWHKVLYDEGIVDHPEPFIKLRNQGMILGEDGVKMSKSRGNVISPDEIVKEHGADVLRLYEMFMGPLEDDKPWSMEKISGVKRFLTKRIWKVVNKAIEDRNEFIDISGKSQLIHRTVKEVSEDIESMKFNTAIAKLMIQFDGLNSKPDWRGKFNRKGEFENKQFDFEALEKFLILLSPFAPHMAEELWEKLGHKASIFKEKWPIFDPDLVKEKEFEMIVQINGKLRDKIRANVDISCENAIKIAKESERIQKWLDGKKIVKEIYVAGKLVNLVVIP